MMLRLETTGQFRKDYKRVKKRGYDMNLLENVIQSLLEERLVADLYNKSRQTGFNCFSYWDTFRPVREVNLAD